VVITKGKRVTLRDKGPFHPAADPLDRHHARRRTDLTPDRREAALVVTKSGVRSVTKMVTNSTDLGWC